MKRIATPLLLLLVVSGCASSTTSTDAFSSMAPALSVERFLQASNTRDLRAMAGIFGTYDGPIEDTGSTFGCFWKKIGTVLGADSCVQWAEVELRMDAISGILRHEDYEITSERTVAGTEHETTRVGVDMTLLGGRVVRDVGFTVVLASGNRWLIQFIELEKITST